MSTVKIQPAKRIGGTFEVPGDKSISHRAVLLAAIAQGDSTIENFLESADCLATLEAIRALSVGVEKLGRGQYRVRGNGLNGFQSPAKVLDLGNSGTGTRLLAGLIAGQSITATITGDESLRLRPMRRIIEPLTRMGATITARSGDLAPLVLRGGNLKGICYEMPVASAQVKSALLLAGLQARGRTTVMEPAPSRDHTERLIQHLGGKIKIGPNFTQVDGPQVLKGATLRVPGDASSAIFLLAAALLQKDSCITIRNVGLNPTRTGYLEVLRRMGASVDIQPEAGISHEPIGTIKITAGRMQGIVLEDPKITGNIIDEIPMLAVLACRAQGTMVIRHASELRVKETDRIKALCQGLQKVGARVEEYPDGLRIEGPAQIKAAVIDSQRDHRIAMAFAVLGFACGVPLEITDTEFIETSFPGFFDLLKKISQ